MLLYIAMGQLMICITLAMFGLCLGSFAGAQVWRLRAKEVKYEKENHEKYDEVEYKKLNKLTKSSILNDHSICLNCSYKLKWYDMIPVISWLCLGGKCRKCKKPIGWTELLIEIFVSLFFVLSYIFWPYQFNNWIQISQFIIWLIVGVGLAVSFVYDAKWSILPDIIGYPLIGLGLINLIFVMILSDNKTNSILSIIGAIFILSGIYWIIYKISQGKWVGFGDIKLGIALALILADWKLAYLTLLSANLLGCIILIPSLLNKKLNFKSHIPFGPLFIMGFIISGLFGNYIINLYISFLI